MIAAQGLLEEEPAQGKPVRPPRVGQQVRFALIRDLRAQLLDVDTLVVVRVERVPTRMRNGLRYSLQQEKANLLMIKNSLFRRALKEMGLEPLAEGLEGTCGVSPIRGEMSAVAKILAQFSKENEGFVLGAGVLKGKILKAQDIRTIAKLPSRQVLLSQLLGGMQASLVGLVGTLQGIERKLVGTLQSIAQKKEKEGKGG